MVPCQERAIAWGYTIAVVIAFGILTVAGFYWIRTPKEPSGLLPVWSLAFSSTGDYLAGGAGGPARIQAGHYVGSGEIRVWNAKEWTEVFSSRMGFTDSVSSVYLPSDDSVSCVSSKLLGNVPGNPFDGVQVRSWSLKDLTAAKPIELQGFRGAGHHHEAYSHVKGLLAISGGEKHYSPRIYDQRTGSVTLVSSKHLNLALCFSADGTRLLSIAHEHPTLRLFDSASGNELAQCDLGQSLAACAQFSPDGKYVAVVDRAVYDKGKLAMPPGGARIHVLEANLKEEIVNIASPYPYLQLPANATVFPEVVLGEQPLAISPDSKSFAVKSDRNAVAIFELTTGKLLQTLDGHEEGVNCVAFSPDGKWLAVGSGGHTRDGKGPGAVRVWDLEKNEVIVHLK